MKTTAKDIVIAFNKCHDKLNLPLIYMQDMSGFEWRCATYYAKMVHLNVIPVIVGRLRAMGLAGKNPFSSLVYRTVKEKIIPELRRMA